MIITLLLSQFEKYKSIRLKILNVKIYSPVFELEILIQTCNTLSFKKTKNLIS